MAAGERLICTSEQLIDGGDGIRFETIFGGQTTAAFVIRYGGRPFGYLNRCGHVPVEMDWQAGKFFDGSRIYLICATHGALYAPENGRCMSGRCAGKGLQALPITEHDGGIYLAEQDK